MNKFIYLLAIAIFILTLISASDLAELPPIKQNDCMPLVQYCANCTYVNITSMTYPNGTTVALNYRTELRGATTYINDTGFCTTSNLGTYVYGSVGDPDGVTVQQSVARDVTSSGANFSNSQSFLVMGQLTIIALFLIMAFSFKQEKWKLKTFFFMMAILFGVILLNTLRIMIGTSNGLAQMGNVGLIAGIAVLLFMFGYFFILMTIEVFGYYKNKRNMRWQVSGA